MKTTLKLIFATALIFLMAACNKDEPLVDLKDTPDDFLSDKYFDELEIEIISIAGHEPNANAMDAMEGFLNNRLNKPRGIELVQKTISSPNNHTYSVSDLRELEEVERTRYRDDHKLAAYIFYADAEFAENSENSKTLGLVYSATSMVIFKNTIDEHSGGFGQVSTEELETAVLFHEWGHLFGLVNAGTPMVQDHEDAGRAGHCDNENCLMYYASETGDLLGLLGSSEIPNFDDQCLEDLKANGGK